MFEKLISLAITFALSPYSSLSAPQARTARKQWLIEDVQGQWEVREGNRRARRMNKFEILTTDSKICCRTLPCTLLYAGADGVAKPFFPATQPARARLNLWIAVPEPLGSPAGPRATGLQEIIAKTGIRGGRRKDSPVCSGQLPLVAPSCGELIDPVDFRLQWSQRPAEAGKAFTLLIGGADSSEKKRWNDIHADSGAYGAKTLDDYLIGLELPDRATDVTIRLMRTESLDAIRLVRLPSKADDGEYRKKLSTFSRLPPLSRQLAKLEEYLTTARWSKAAEIAQELLRDAPESVEIQKYALVGFCRSDFAEEVARLRTSLKGAGVTGFCESDGAP